MNKFCTRCRVCHGAENSKRFFLRRTGRRKRGTQLRDHIPVDNLAALSIQRSNSTSENHIESGQPASEVARTSRQHEDSGESKPAYEISTLGPCVPPAASDYPPSSGRSRRSGNKSSRGKDAPRNAGATAVPAGKRAVIGNSNGRRSDVGGRRMRGEVGRVTGGQQHGLLVARTIYTNDRKMRSEGDELAERFTTSTTLAVTGLIVYFFITRFLILYFFGC